MRPTELLLQYQRLGDRIRTLTDQGESAFRYAMIELGLLTAMTGVLVTCLVGLRKRDKEAVAERA